MPQDPAPQIVGLGMSVLDLLQVVEAFPAAGGVTRVEASALMGGGPVPTALCAASRFGTRAAILDRIGDDWRGARLREDYERHGVITDQLLTERGGRSPQGTVLVRRGDGERHLLYEEGDTRPLAAEELPDGLLERCAVLHLNGRHWPACLRAAERVRRAGGLVSFDGGAHRYDAEKVELLSLVDVLVVAADFADRAVGAAPCLEQLERLARWGGRLVGITEGARGSWFLPEGEAPFWQAAYPPPRLVDTTGCGDVFHGVFLASRVQGEPWSQCARLAAAAASLAATALGGRGALPTRAETEAFLATQD